jgi:hypothetical protein
VEVPHGRATVTLGWLLMLLPLTQLSGRPFSKRYAENAAYDQRSQETCLKFYRFALRVKEQEGRVPYMLYKLLSGLFSRSVGRSFYFAIHETFNPLRITR